MHVFMDIIQKVVDVEDYQLQRKAAAEAEAKQIIAEAERNGLALLQQTREAAAESGKALLREAEDRAAQRAGEIQKAAEREAGALREAAGRHLEEAAEFIVERVVSH